MSDLHDRLNLSKKDLSMISFSSTPVTVTDFFKGPVTLSNFLGNLSRNV